jgi:hypothetical protein
MAMISANVVLVLSGLICLGVAGFMIYRFIPQEGRAPSALTRTGVGLMAKGIF